MGLFRLCIHIGKTRLRVSLTDLKMRYVAAYLLATLGGSKNPSESDIEKILGSGIEAESDKMKAVVSELKGKDLEALIAAGQQKLASVPSGGGVAVSAGGAAPAAAADAPAKEEAKKEEKKEDSDESDEDMGFGLFD